jgi:hypothetical protein
LAFEVAIGLKFGCSLATSLIHLVVAGPGEGNVVGVSGSIDRAGDAAESELPAAFTVEEDVGGFDHVGIVGGVVRHLDDAPLSLHAAAPMSLGRRIRL